jgi:hypothetical protein
MKPATVSSPQSRAIRSELAPSYADRLAELEARRRAADDVILRKMLHSREPMNPG